MALRSWLWVCFEKKMHDLDLLIACPNHVQYFSKFSPDLLHLSLKPLRTTQCRQST